MAMGTHFHTFYFKNVVTFWNKECMLEMVLQNKRNKFFACIIWQRSM